MMPGASRALALVKNASAEPSPVWTAGWPDDGAATQGLAAVAARALDERQALLLAAAAPSAEDVEGTRLLANPLMINGECIGAVAVELPPAVDAEGAVSLQLLRWGTTWFEFFLKQLTSQRELGLWTMLELVRLSLEGQSLSEAAHAATSELATRFGCERVSLGVVRGRSINIVAFTHGQAELRNSELKRALADAMHEAIDQDRLIVFPAVKPNSITRQHKALASDHGAGAVCSVPLCGHDGVFAALTLEHADAQGFDDDGIAALNAAAGLLGPLLATRRAAERPWWRALGAAIADAGAIALGRGHWVAKTVGLSVCAGILALVFIESDYRVDANASVQGREQRAIVVPFDGYVAAARVRAGDEVRAGDLLVRLQDQELRLERSRWVGEEAEVAREYREALARHRSAQVVVLNARLEQAQARIAQIDYRLDRTTVRAPIDGVIVQGDLTHSIGAPVEQGQVLYEVAPLDDYRLALELEERDIGVIETGQSGNVALAGQGEARFPFTVERIWPVSKVSEGRNVFRVEATLTGAGTALRPGMSGLAKVDIGTRRLGWLWTHRMIEQLRFWAWSWGWSA